MSILSDIIITIFSFFFRVSQGATFSSIKYGMARDSPHEIIVPLEMFFSEHSTGYAHVVAIC